MSTVYRRLRPQSEDNTSYDHLDQVRVMVFNNISVILWQQVLLMEETRIPGENHRPTEVIDKHYHLMLDRVHLT